MNTENSDSIPVNEDLDAFSDEFFNGSASPEEPAAVEESENEDADDTSSVEDTDATNEQEPKGSEDESNESEDEEEEAPVEKPRKKSAQERISELTAARREAERQAQEWERKFNEALASKGKEEEDKSTPAAANDTGAPDPDATNEDGSLKYPLGEYDPAYVRDNARHIFKEEMEAVRREEQEAAQRQQVVDARTELTLDWNNKLNEAEASEEMADIREVGADLVNAFSDLDPDYGDFLATTIMGLEKGTEVFYYLANNLDEARAIADAGGVSATIALGALQERLRGPKEPEGGKTVKPKVSNAPPPPKNINRGVNGRFETPDDTEDLDAFAEKFFKGK